MNWSTILNVANFIIAAVCAVYAWKLYKITQIGATLCLMWGFIFGAIFRAVLIGYKGFPAIEIFAIAWIFLALGMISLHRAVKKIWDKPEGTR